MVSASRGSAPRAPADPRPALWPTAIAALAVYFLMVWIMPTFVPDDSYISFRYALNLAHGHGLVFNAGEPPVEGYSNFLWILLCAAMTPFGALPVLAPAAGTALGALCVLLLARLLQRRAASQAELAIPLALLSVSGAFVLYSISGMETPLFEALLLMLLLCADRVFERNSRAAWLGLAALAGALALTRPEGVIAFPVLALCALVLKDGRIDARQARTRLPNFLLATLLFAAIFAAYNAWRIAYFGHLLPTSFAAKGSSGAGIANAVDMNFYSLFVKQAHNYMPTGYFLLCLFALAAAGTWPAPAGRAKASFDRTCLIAAVLFGLVYLNFVDWMPANRYDSMLIVFLLPPLAATIRPLSGRSTALLAVPLFLLALFTTVGVYADGKRPEFGRHGSLVELGKWLRIAVPPDALLAMGDVGATPYYSGLRTVDINPRSLVNGHIARYGLSAAYFYDRNPDVVIVVSGSPTTPLFYDKYEPIVRDPRFGVYRLVGVSGYDRTERCYWVYIRRSMMPTPASLKAFPRRLR